MKRVHQPENNRSLAGSSFDSSDEDETRSFCYSPQDEDQRRRFCDLVALALASSSRDYGSAQPQSAPWEGDESDSESHPSLESDAEAELLDLFDEEDENESGCFLESESSTTSPSVDGSSFESYDATVIQNRKLPLLARQQRQPSAPFRETNSFCTNHANLLSPDLVILVERLSKERRRTAPKEKIRDKEDKSQSGSREAKPSESNIAHRTRSASVAKRSQPPAEKTPDGDGKNATVMDQLRKLVYKKYDKPRPDLSETESIRSSILPLSPSLLSYREALRLSSSANDKSSGTVLKSPRTKHEENGSRKSSTEVKPSSAPCDLEARKAEESLGDQPRRSKKRAAERWMFSDASATAGVEVDTGKDSRQTSTGKGKSESSTNSRSTSVPLGNENVRTGVVTRSMLRKSGGVLASPKSQTSQRFHPDIDFSGTVHQAVDPDEPSEPNVGMSAGDCDIQGGNVFALSAAAEQNRSEASVFNMETSLPVVSRVDPARSV